MTSNSNYRSGAMRSVPDSELPRKTTEVRSGSLQDRRSATVGLLRVSPTVRVVVRDGKLVVVGK
jgi:hypothetical protein